MTALSDALLGKNSTATTTKPTYADYAAWVANVSADTKDKWKQGASQFGFNARKARKAFIKGNFDSYINPYRSKLERNYYAWRDPNTGKVVLIAEGDDNYDAEAFQAAKFKGTDRNKVASAYQDALSKARQNATIIYDKGKNRYYVSYKVGDWDVTNADITDSDWFKSDTTKQKNAQLSTYGKAVDAYNTDQFANYLGEDGKALLKAINYKDADKVDNYSSLEDDEKETLKTNIANALKKHYRDMSQENGKVTWDRSVQADAWWKKMMDYYNDRGISWLSTLAWQPVSRYQDYTNLASTAGTPSTSTTAGNLIGFSKKGGFLRARTLAKGGRIPKRISGGDLVNFGLSMLPYYDAIQAARKGEWEAALTSAALDTAGLAVGGFAGKALLKGGARALKFFTKSGKIAKAEKTVEKFTKQQKTFTNKQKKFGKLAKAAEKAGNETDSQLYRAAAAKAEAEAAKASKTVKNAKEKVKELTKTLEDQANRKEAYALAYPYKNGIKNFSKNVAVGLPIFAAGKYALANTSSGFPQASTAAKQASKQKADEEDVATTQGEGTVSYDNAGNAYVQSPDGTVRPLPREELYNNSQVVTISKQGGIIETLHNKYLNKHGFTKINK